MCVTTKIQVEQGAEPHTQPAHHTTWEETHHQFTIEDRGAGSNAATAGGIDGVINALVQREHKQRRHTCILSVALLRSLAGINGVELGMANCKWW